MKLNFGIILVALLLSSNAEGDHRKFLNITGVVRDGESGRPLAKAKVILEKRNYSLLENLSRGGLDALPTPLGKTWTNADGNFTFKTSASGQFEISVWRRAT